MFHDVAGLLQAADHEAGDVLVVLDNQDAHVFYLLSVRSLRVSRAIAAAGGRW